MIRSVAQKSQPRPEAPPAPLPRAGGRLDVAECYRYCEALARAHHENFPVASLFLPERLRRHVFALYAFARTADDVTDEPAWEGRRVEELDRLEDRLVRAWHGEADHPIFVALSETASACELPIAPLQDLLSAFRMDLVKRRYSTFGELSSYTSLAAQPIGRLLLYVFGVRDPERHRYADALSSALALTGFWQDLSRDLARGRVYIPQEDLRYFDVREADLLDRKPGANAHALVRFQTARTASLYERARPLLGKVDDELAVEIGLFFAGGEAILAKTARAGAGALTSRPQLSTVDKARVVSSVLATRGARGVARELRRLLG